MIAKAAITLDGCIADETGNAKWISSESSRKKVHAMRAENDAVLVGMRTVIRGMTPADGAGCSGSTIPCELSLIRGEAFRKVQHSLRGEAQAHSCATTQSGADENWMRAMREYNADLIVSLEQNAAALTDGLKQLGERGIQSILAEGGGRLHGMLAKAEPYRPSGAFYRAETAGGGNPDDEDTATPDAGCTKLSFEEMGAKRRGHAFFRDHEKIRVRPEMFTGIIETQGKIAGIDRKGGTFRIRIKAPEIAPELRVDDSVAVNGNIPPDRDRTAGGGFFG
ncbi:MAG: dihydrofolate reductase family protein [Candidatus Marinimicrobia bacterium]|nr:dihydrofolate reductase family protein [Candidatus Neomarinimicrobiota bacterium]